jgi:hypothetical protein
MREEAIMAAVTGGSKVPVMHFWVKASRPEKRVVREAGWEALRRSWRWEGRRPPGPPAAPGGKELMSLCRWSRR